MSICQIVSSMVVYFSGEPSMVQCQSRGKLLANFKGHWSIQISLKTRQRGHWSIRISPEIHMGQLLPNLSESSGLHRYGSIECSSLDLTENSDQSWDPAIPQPVSHRQNVRQSPSHQIEPLALVCLTVADGKTPRKPHL